MTYFTPDRLLLIAIIITLISADGVYRAWKQRGDELIGPRLFVTYAGVLALGTALVWVGFIVGWQK